MKRFQHIDFPPILFLCDCWLVSVEAQKKIRQNCLCPIIYGILSLSLASSIKYFARTVRKSFFLFARVEWNRCRVLNEFSLLCTNKSLRYPPSPKNSNHNRIQHTSTQPHITIEQMKLETKDMNGSSLQRSGRFCLDFHAFVVVVFSFAELFFSLSFCIPMAYGKKRTYRKRYALQQLKHEVLPCARATLFCDMRFIRIEFVIRFKFTAKQ